MSKIGSIGILAVLVFASFGAHAQRDTSYAFGMGIYATYYMPDNATAGYYNGRDNNRLKNYINNPQIRDRIEEALGGYPFDMLEYANDMVYNNTFAFELELDYRFGNNWRILAHFVNAQLEAMGNFTLRVHRANHNNQTTDPYIEKASITGKESRSHINLGVGKVFPLGQNFVATAEGGLDMNFIEVTNNRILIADQPFSLPIYNNEQNRQAQQITTFGTGFFLSGGLAYEMTSGYGFSLKTTYYNTSIDVNEVVAAKSGIFTVGVGFSKAW